MNNNFMNNKIRVYSMLFQFRQTVWHSNLANQYINAIDGQANIKKNKSFFWVFFYDLLDDDPCVNTTKTHA